ARHPRGARRRDLGRSGAITPRRVLAAQPPLSDGAVQPVLDEPLAGQLVGGTSAGRHPLAERRPLVLGQRDQVLLHARACPGERTRSRWRACEAIDSRRSAVGLYWPVGWGEAPTAEP